MTYTEYNKLTTEELLSHAFSNADIDPLALELAIRLADVIDQWDAEHEVSAEDLYAIIGDMEK